MQQNDAYKRAIAYRKAGISFYPVDDDSKTAIVKWKRFQNKIPSERQTRIWFEKHEYQNMSIVTGKISNLIVIDCDDYHGILTWEYLCRKHNDENSIKTVTVDTRRGKHFYYTYPKGIEIPTKNRHFGHHIEVEIKSDGSSVKAPPSSYTDDSGYYEFDKTYKIKPFPTWLVNEFEMENRIDEINDRFVRSSGYEKDGEKWLEEAIVKAGVGSRNYTCVWLSDQLRDDRIPLEYARTLVREYVKRVPQSPEDEYTIEEAFATLESRYKLPRREPAKKV